MQAAASSVNFLGGNFSSQRSGILVNKEKTRRGMWIHEHTFSREDIAKGKDFKEGFYMFGG